MPILARLNAKNRPKSPFSIGVTFSIISEFTVITRDASMQESVLMPWCKRLLRAATGLSVPAKPGKSGPLFLGDLPTEGVF
jgi:hypothetical protein